MQLRIRSLDRHNNGNTLSKQLWLWCVSRNIWISAAHIAGKPNQQADLESRQNKTETEWMLHKNSLSCALTQLNFPPEIDLFASKLNTQFTHHVAYTRRSQSIEIDIENQSIHSISIDINRRLISAIDHNRTRRKKLSIFIDWQKSITIDNNR